MNLKTLKKKLREKIHVTLREQAAQLNPEAPQNVRDLFFAHFRNLDKGLVISGTMPIKRELDVMPLLEALAERGHTLCLPVILKKGEPLLFRAYKPGDALEAGIWGIGTPAATQAECEPDIIIMPFLAFDRKGRRLGYGGGYYDATLKSLRAKKKLKAIGIGYAAQEVEEVPVGAYDEPLDRIITEKEVIVPE